MFKLEYTSGDGRIISLYDRPYRLMLVEGIGGVEIANTLQKTMLQDGVSLVNSSLEPRYMSITLKIVGKDQAETERLRAELTDIFGPGLGAGTLTYIGGSLREIKCIAESTPYYPDGIGNRGATYQKAQIELIAPNPHWRGVGEIKENVSTEVGGFEFPLNIPATGLELSIRAVNYITNIYNSGSVKAPIRVRLRATGTVQSPIITNLRTGEFIRVKRTLTKGEILEINTEFGNKKVEIITENGTRENAFNYIDYKSKFFVLAPGDNTIKYSSETGDSNLDVAIYYTPRYLGV